MNTRITLIALIILSLVSCGVDKDGNFCFGSDCSDPTTPTAPMDDPPPPSIVACMQFNGLSIPLQLDNNTLGVFTQGNTYNEVEYVIAYISALTDAQRCLPQLAIEQLNLHNTHLGLLGPVSSECLSFDSNSGAIQRIGVQSSQGFYRGVSTLLCRQAEGWSERCVMVFGGERELCS